MLLSCLIARRKNVAIAREINEVKDFIQLAHRYRIEPADSTFQLQFRRRWWLEDIFYRMHLSYVEGVFVIYFFTMLPRILVLPIVISSGHQGFQIAYFASYIGDLVIVYSLLLLNVVYDGLKQLVDSVNKNLVHRFVMPSFLIKDEDLCSDKMLEELDEKYRQYYIRPVVGKTLQLGLDLAFNKLYQLGSGMISSGIFFIILMMRYVLNLIPESVFSISVPLSTIADFWFFYSIFMVAFLWFIVGMMAWSLFLTFLIVIQISGNPIKIRPFEKVKEQFQPLTTSVLKISFTITVIAGWFSPYLLVWSIGSSSPYTRESVTNFLEAVLVVTIPIIIISFVVPLIKIHTGMDRSRDRALSIKLQQLEELRKKPIENLNQHMKIQKHLTEDYIMIQQQSEWALSFTQFLEVFGTVLLPILSFLLSRL